MLGKLSIIGAVAAILQGRIEGWMVASLLANNRFASFCDNRRPGDGFSRTTMGNEHERQGWT